MQIGVPSVGFIFGYVKGSPEEAAYREWYAKRYHSPLDDIKQPWVPQAAANFNDFFAKLVETVRSTIDPYVAASWAMVVRVASELSICSRVRSTWVRRRL